MLIIQIMCTCPHILGLCYLLFCLMRAGLNVCFCTGYFDKVPFSLTCLHCLQHISLNIPLFCFLVILILVFVIFKALSMLLIDKDFSSIFGEYLILLISLLSSTILKKILPVHWSLYGT